MTTLPDLESLRVLAEVARTGSLGQAAQAIGISQPAASLRIQALERRFRLQLLVRDTRGSRLTPAGVRVVDLSARVLGATEDLMEGVAKLQQELTTTLRVAASLTIAESLIPDWLVRLHSTFPEITVELTVANSSDVMAQVQSGDMHLGFVESPHISADLQAVTVGLDRLVLVVAPSHPWADRGDPVSGRELLQTRLFLREPGSGTRETLEAAIQELGILAAPALQLSTTAAIRGAVLRGTAPAVLSELSVRADLVSGALVEVPVSDVKLHRRLQAVWPRGMKPTQSAERLLALILPSPTAGKLG